MNKRMNGPGSNRASAPRVQPGLQGACKQIACRVLCIRLFCFALTGKAQVTNIWSGGGNDFQFTNPANWSLGTVPGAGNDAIVNAESGITITNSGSITLHNLTCSEAVSLQITGSLTISGSGTMAGNLTMGVDSSMTAQGMGANVQFSGPVTADGASLYASQGGMMILPGLLTYSHAGSTNHYLQASGSTSILSLPNLTQIHGPTNQYNQFINALQGGALLLPAVTNITGTRAGASGSYTWIQASGDSKAPSQLDLSGLLAFVDHAATGGARSYLLAEHGSQIIAPNLAILDGPSAYVEDGSVVNLPALREFKPGSGEPRTLQATGAGSVLNATNLPVIYGSDSMYNCLLFASDGGQLNLSGVTNIFGTLAGASGSGTLIEAYGEPNHPSRLDLSGLLAFVDQATNKGAHSYLSAESGSQIIAPNLTVLDGPSAFAKGGSVFDLPALRELKPRSGEPCTLQATGRGSNLSDLSLGLINGNYDGSEVLVRADTGGTLNLGGVTNIVGTFHDTNVDIKVAAVGSGSVVVLTNLASYVSLYSPSFLQEWDGGVILLNDNVAYTNVQYLYYTGPRLLPNGAVGVPYELRLAVAASSPDGLTWSVTSGALPAGLSLNSTTALITGTPTAPGGGTATFRVHVEDRKQNHTDADLSLFVAVGLGTPWLADGKLYFLLAGQANQTWRIESSTDLLHWQIVQTVMLDNMGNWTVSQPVAAGTVEFFRAQLAQ